MGCHFLVRVELSFVEGGGRGATSNGDMILYLNNENGKKTIYEIEEYSCVVLHV